MRERVDLARSSGVEPQEVGAVVVARGVTGLLAAVLTGVFARHESVFVLLVYFGATWGCIHSTYWYAKLVVRAIALRATDDEMLTLRWSAAIIPAAAWLAYRVWKSEYDFELIALPIVWIGSLYFACMGALIASAVARWIAGK